MGEGFFESGTEHYYILTSHRSDVNMLGMLYGDVLGFRQSSMVKSASNVELLQNTEPATPSTTGR